MTALEIIRLTMPEFKPVTDVDAEKWIGLHRSLVSEKQFGDQYEHAVALITAHKMKLSGLGESSVAGLNLNTVAANGLASVSEGNTSISFDTAMSSTAATDPESAEYAKTTYGLQYLALRQKMVIPIMLDWSGVYGIE